MEGVFQEIICRETNVMFGHLDNSKEEKIEHALDICPNEMKQAIKYKYIYMKNEEAVELDNRLRRELRSLKPIWFLCLIGQQ